MSSQQQTPNSPIAPTGCELAEVTGSVLRLGDTATLEENDAFGTQTLVTVLKVHSGGNAKVLEGTTIREVSVKRLRKLNTPFPGLPADYELVPGTTPTQR